MRAKNEFKFIAEAYQNVHKEGTDKRFRLVGVGGYHSQIENVEGEFDTVDEVIDHIEPQYLRGNKNNPAYQNRLKVISKLREEIKDPSNWSSEGFEDGLLRFGIGEIYEVVDTQSAEDDEYDQERKDNIDYARSKRYESEEPDPLDAKRPFHPYRAARGIPMP